MAEEFIPCTTMYLPAETQLEAARIATDINPINRPASDIMGISGIILPPNSLAVLTARYWGNGGVRLTVGFMEQTPVDLQKKILSHFNAWGEFCNVTCSLTATDPQVRITRSGQGYWSYLGTDILSIPRNEPTMCLQGFTMSTSEREFRRVVRHEFGHTMGFPHEHMRRQIVQRLDPQKTIAYFRQTQGWSPAMVQQQVLTPLAEQSIMGSPDADETSIMAYSLPAQITVDNRPIIGGSDIEHQDREFAAKIYPKAAGPTDPVDPPTPPPPPVASGNVLLSCFGTKLTLSLTNKTLLAEFPDATWKATRKVASSILGDFEMSKAKKASAAVQSKMSAMADELEAALPQAEALDSAKQGALGGIIADFYALVTALRAGDIMAVGEAFYKLLGTLLGKSGGDGGIEFQTESAAIGWDWATLKSILKRILPLILGEVL